MLERMALANKFIARGAGAWIACVASVSTRVITRRFETHAMQASAWK